MERLSRIYRNVSLRAVVTVVALLLVCCTTARAQNGPIESAQASNGGLGGLLGPRQFSNDPDDVGYQLFESEEQVDGIFPAGPLDPLHKFWLRMNQQLKECPRLDVGLNYTVVYQRADTTVNGPRDSSDGDVDFFGRWHLTGYEDQWPGSLVFNTE